MCIKAYVEKHIREGMSLILIVLLMLGLVFTVIPFLIRKWGCSVGSGFTYAEYGTWLQGALTPLVVLIAAIGLYRTKSSDNRTLFITNEWRFYEHINYISKVCIVGGKDFSAESHTLSSVEKLIKILNGGKNDEDDTRTADVIRNEDWFKELKRDVYIVYNLARLGGIEPLLHGPIQQLKKILDEAP